MMRLSRSAISRPTTSLLGFGKGFTLVELMVAMVISLFLIGGMIQVYMSNKVSYRFGEALSRVQENGRFAMEYLSTDIRMADFWGCAELADVQNNLDDTAAGYVDFGAGGVQGTEGASGAPDSLTIGGAFDRGLTVQEPYMPNVSAAIFVSSPSGLAVDDVVMVSDCLGGDIFQITNKQQGTGGNSGKETLVHNAGAGSIGNASKDLSKTYKGDATVYQVSSTTFFIQNNPINEPALYMTANGITQELVEGVEDMQILYGEDTDADGIPNRYVAANAIADTEQVLAIRVSLLIRSFEDNVVDAPQSYTYDGNNVTAGDRRLRQVFTSTISLRNRIN